MLLTQNNNASLSLQNRCELLDLNRSAAYYTLAELSRENTGLMNMIYEIWSEYPFYGYRKLTVVLQNYGLKVNHKRILRLMNCMGIQAIYKKRKVIANKKDPNLGA
jgi:putative transposase